MFETVGGSDDGDAGAGPLLLGAAAVPVTWVFWLILEGVLPGAENWSRYLVGMGGGFLILALGAWSGLRAFRSKRRRALSLVVLMVNVLCCALVLIQLLLGATD